MVPRRLILMAAAGVFCLVIAVMGAGLLKSLKELSTAGGDNMLWTISQVELEVANLKAALAENLISDTPDEDQVILRTDIMLSRLALLQRGQTQEAFAGNDKAMTLLAEADRYWKRAAEIVDQPGGVSRASVMELFEETQAIQPKIRQITLMAVSFGAQQSGVRRDEFSRELLLTGGTALALLAIMSVMLLVLDRLLAQARERDAALRVSTQRLASTVAASLDGIITADEEGRIIGFNKAAERILGWSQGEILGKQLDQTIIPRRYRAKHRDGMKRFLQGGPPRMVNSARVEFSALRKTGEEFPVELNVTSVNEGGRQTFVAYLRDISAQKISERGLIDARDRAERADRAKSQFMAVMSHEMRTPLNGILGVLDLLRTTKLAPRQDRYVQIATASGEILLGHVNEALDVARIESGAMSLNPQAFDLQRMVRDTVESLTPLAQEKNLTVRLRFSPSMARGFVGDSNRIRQIITNLFGNAVKFTETGSIEVSVDGIHGADQTVMTVAVTDTGTGIRPEDMDDIFEDFVALANPAGRQSRGDGLGLPVSRKIARMMGGDLKATSQIDKGSTFILTLPLRRAGRSDLPDDAAAPIRTSDGPVQARNVLVVEDNSVNRTVLSDMLLALGHRVTTAENGLEGLEKAGEQAFDIILMDISMPDMDGIEATRRIRQGQGPNRSTPILGLSAHGREEYRERAQAAGMDGYRTKPIRLPVLRRLVGDLDTSVGEAVDDRRGDIDPQVFRELREVLGPERAGGTARRFFEELDDGLAALSGPEAVRDAGAISDRIHKLRGGAVLLGLQGLSDALGDISDAARRDDRALTLQALSRAQDHAARTKADFLDLQDAAT